MSKFSKGIRALAVGLILTMAVSFSGFTGECDQIRSHVVRLHILANSDSQEDQQLKLKVRDTVVNTAANLFDEASDASEALEQVQAKLPEIEAAAQQRVYDEGYDYKVHAQLCNMYFTTRRYDTVTLPAGQYNAVRITIGSGKGHNWWCVIFPPLCVSASTDASKLDDVLEPEQKNIVTDEPHYEIRFKVVEIIQSIGQKFKEWFGNKK